MKKTITSIFILLSLLNTHWSFAQNIKIVAHRGGVNWGPENTIVTFLIAAEKGIDYVEMDIRQTKDGKFILMHDQDVGRTTNGKGLVKDLTLEEVQKLDAGSWYGKEFKGEKVPTLREVLKAIDGKILPDLDFKDGDPVALIALLQEEGYLDGRLLTLYSGNHELIAEIQALTDKIQVRPSIKTSFEDLATTLNPPIVNLSWKKFSPNLQNEIRGEDSKTFVNCLFTANRKRALRKAVELEPDFIQTDKLDYLLDLLGR